MFWPAIDFISPSGAPRSQANETDDFQVDEAAVPGLSLAAVRELASPVSKLTFTVVPRGSGQRIGVDRDRDGVLDFDEL